MKINRCLNCGYIVLKRSGFDNFCSLKCKLEYDNKLSQEDKEFQDKLINLDIIEKRKTRNEVLKRRQL